MSFSQRTHLYTIFSLSLYIYILTVFMIYGLYSLGCIMRSLSCIFYFKTDTWSLGCTYTYPSGLYLYVPLGVYCVFNGAS
jgi:hypothetical protein